MHGTLPAQGCGCSIDGRARLCDLRFTVRKSGCVAAQAISGREACTFGISRVGRMAGVVTCARRNTVHSLIRRSDSHRDRRLGSRGRCPMASPVTSLLHICRASACNYLRGSILCPGISRRFEAGFLRQPRRTKNATTNASHAQLTARSDPGGSARARPAECTQVAGKKS